MPSDAIDTLDPHRDVRGFPVAGMAESHPLTRNQLFERRRRTANMENASRAMRPQYRRFRGAVNANGVARVPKAARSTRSGAKLTGFYKFAGEVARVPFGIPFPGRRASFNRFIASCEPYWKTAPIRWVRSKVHGLLIPCDLQTFSGRIAYYFRRWYELDTQSVILTLLSPGDTFVDIGSNVGMASLTAAKAVGPSGHILAFEPNPPVHAIFAEAIARNKLRNIHLLNAAVSETAGQLDLFVPTNNHGEASLGIPLDDRSGSNVKAEILDGTAVSQLKSIHLIKIDVEGHEEYVLKALIDSIDRERPFIITEICEDHLRRNSSSSHSIIELMTTLDYLAFCYREQGRGLFGRAAELYPLDPAGEQCRNVLWVPRERSSDRRLETFAVVSN